jgi:hypothetical protein
MTDTTDRPTEPAPLECFGCGLRGDYGSPFPVPMKCPACGSLEVWSATTDEPGPVLVDTGARLVGRITIPGDRERVAVELRSEYRRGPFQTIDHREVPGVWRIGVSGLAWYGNEREPSSAGQIVEHLDSIDAPADGWTGEDVADLVKFWRRWHLNDLHAGCAHQPDATTQPGWTTSDKLDNTPPCPETGYRWGTAWLVEELDADAWREVHRFAELLGASRKWSDREGWAK